MKVSGSARTLEAAKAAQAACEARGYKAQGEPVAYVRNPSPPPVNARRKALQDRRKAGRGAA